MFEQIMEKKIDEVSDKVKNAKNMFDLNGLSDKDMELGKFIEDCYTQMGNKK